MVSVYIYIGAGVGMYIYTSPYEQDLTLSQFLSEV